MTTPLTLRTPLGRDLTFEELDGNFEALRGTADQALAATVGLSGGMIGKATLALLNADLAWPDGQIALVTNDATSANNGTYRKTGASGAGSWVAASTDRLTAVEFRATNTAISWVASGGVNAAYIQKLSSTDSALTRTDWQGKWSLSTATRRILNKKSEPLLADLLTRSATVTQGNITDHGLSNGVTFPAIAQVDYGYLGIGDPILVGTTYTATLFVKMADSTQPKAGTTTDITKDFSVLIAGVAQNNSAVTIYTDLGGGLWRIDLPGILVITVNSQTYGVIRYATQSGKGFTVTGFNLTAAASPAPYYPNPGTTYLDVSDYSVGSDGKLTFTPTPAAGTVFQWEPTTLAPASVATRVTALESDQVNRAKINPTTHEVRGSFAPFTQFTPAHGVAEMDGDSDYAFALLGLYETMVEDSVFDSIRARIWSSTTPSDVEWRLWIRNATGSFDTSAVTPDDSGTIPAALFPTTSQIYTLKLNKAIAASTGKVVTLIFRKTDGSSVSIRKWGTAGPGGRHAFYLSGSTTWPTSFSVSTLPTYGQAAMQLTLGAAALASALVPDVVMPPYVYAVVGREASVYLDNLVYQDAGDFHWDVTCTQGQHQNERWTSGLAPAPGTVALSLGIYSKDSETLLTSASTSLVVKAAGAGAGLNRKVLVIGDSTTAAGTTTGELVNIFSTDAMAITLLGTKGAGSNKHEGISGWTVNQFFTDVTSPFVFSGAFNFSSYMSANAYAAVDWVLINLGINDVFSQTSDAGVDSVAAAMAIQLESMITSIHAFDPAVRIGLCVTTPPSATNDGFGANYGCGQTRWRFKRNILRLGRTIINQFQGRETSGKTFIVPLLVCLDTLHNMQSATVAANSRTATTVTRLTNGVHPDATGYYQCADAYYAFLKGQEA
jgi:lysophospholipase L1-like esterase